MKYVRSTTSIGLLFIISIPIYHGLQLRDVFAKKIESGEDVIDVFHWTSLAALEYIGRGGLGHAFDALNPYKKNEYNEFIKAAM